MRAPRYELMRPGEIENERRKTPVVYIPWGSLEWHGVHNCIGVDALKAHALCIDAAHKTGGIVMPPIFAGYHTMKYRGFKHTIEISRDLVQRMLREYLEQLYDEDFRVIVLVMGHYGRAHVDALREVCGQFQAAHPDARILAFPEYEVVLDEGVRGDHAGAYETSLMMYYYPDTVDLGQLPTDRELTVEQDGIGGDDPRTHATAPVSYTHLTLPTKA